MQLCCTRSPINRWLKRYAWAKREREVMKTKTQALQVRLTEEENAAFKKLAEAVGASRSSLARKWIREAINGSPDLLTDEANVLRIAISQLVGIANNLNQVTKAMHTGITHRTVDEAYLKSLKKYVSSVKAELATLVVHTKKRWVNSDAL